MAITPGPLGTDAALEQIEDALDRCATSRVGVADRARLALVERARVLSGRLEALLCTLLAEADAAQASLKALRTTRQGLPLWARVITVSPLPAAI